MDRGAGDPSTDYKANLEVGERESLSDPLEAGQLLVPRDCARRSNVAPTSDRVMTPSAADASPPRVRLCRLETPEECRAVEQVQRAAWGLSTDGSVPAPIQRAIAHNGGLLLGAYEGTRLVGFALGFLGREGAKLYHYSHMTGVLPDAQNRHVGLALKAFQRKEVLRQDLSEIRWTFDPIQSKNAFFNVRRLGGLPDQYYPRYYGAMADAINEGLETDRFRLIWSLNDPRVVARLGGRLPTAAEDEHRYRTSSALMETVAGPSGVRRPVAVKPAEGSTLHLEIPYDLGSVRSRDPGGIRRWRELTRAAFTAAFDAGYRVEDFAVVPLSGERRSFYFLSRPGAS